MNGEKHGSAFRIGVTSAALGVAAGVVEVVFGTQSWTGNKNDPATLGAVSIGLGLVMAAAILSTERRRTTSSLIGAALCMFVCGAVGLTTAGMAWGPAAVTAGITGAMTLRGATRSGSAARAAADGLPAVLLSALAVIYLTFGVVAGGVTGFLGVVGAAAIFVAIATRLRLHRSAALILASGAIPFAIVALSSVVVPTTSLLMLVIGLPHLLGHRHSKPCAAVALPGAGIALQRRDA